MNKLKETGLIVNFVSELDDSGSSLANTIMLMDIAKSLAMIVDKLYKTEREE